MYVVYVLQSQRDRKRYIGVTRDLERRLREHATGRVASTRMRRPLTVLYTERYDLKEKAERRERYLKSGAGREWLDRRNIR
ncbi:MAG: hypothetical protein A2564_01255 [Candidatus Wildermuthbacteria bacterium RIFOXYD1_FULL_50_12]|nr:MAG: hypothetical protein A2564_01255 [Candidatus Wildermuthbacteria bacterium RIFOXYD1_FULL_50_12]